MDKIPRAKTLIEYEFLKKQLLDSGDGKLVDAFALGHAMGFIPKDRRDAFLERVKEEVANWNSVTRHCCSS